MRTIGAATDIPGCILWLDASDLSSITKDGSNKVSQWSDKSGNAKHATQAVGANQPTYSATGFGGLPCIDWGAGAASRKLDIPSITYGPHTIFVVLRGDASAGYFWVHLNDSTDYLYGNTNIASGVVRSAVSTYKNPVPSAWLRDSTRRIVTRSFGGLHGSHLIYGNGLRYTTTDQSAGDPGTGTVAGACYIGTNQGGAVSWTGVIAEVILFDRALSDGERTLVEQYLARKWGIPTRQIASPLDLADCAMWFDAGQGITSDANGVSAWNDMSGNARHVAQSNNTFKPTFNASNAAYGGKPTVDWDTVGNFDRLDRSANDALTQPLTIFACCNIANATATGIPVFSNVSGLEIGIGRVNASTWYTFAGVGSASFPTPPVGTRPFVAALVFNGVHSQTRIGGRAVTALGSLTDTTGITTLRLGCFAGGSYPSWDGSIAEFLVYRRRLSDGEIAMVEAYLRRKYAL